MVRSGRAACSRLGAGLRRRGRLAWSHGPAEHASSTTTSLGIDLGVPGTSTGLSGNAASLDVSGDTSSTVAVCIAMISLKHLSGKKHDFDSQSITVNNSQQSVAVSSSQQQSAAQSALLVG